MLRTSFTPRTRLRLDTSAISANNAQDVARSEPKPSVSSTGSSLPPSLLRDIIDKWEELALPTPRLKAWPPGHHWNTVDKFNGDADKAQTGYVCKNAPPKSYGQHPAVSTFDDDDDEDIPELVEVEDDDNALGSLSKESRAGSIEIQGLPSNSQDTGESLSPSFNAGKTSL